MYIALNFQPCLSSCLWTLVLFTKVFFLIGKESRTPGHLISENDSILSRYLALQCGVFLFCFDFFLNGFGLDQWCLENTNETAWEVLSTSRGSQRTLHEVFMACKIYVSRDKGDETMQRHSSISGSHTFSARDSFHNPGTEISKIHQVIKYIINKFIKNN